MFFVYCLHPCNNDPLPNEQFVLAKLNEEIKPPLTYVDLKKIDEAKSNQMGQHVYWMKYQTKLVAGSDLHVFTKRGFSGMDTFYVDDPDSSYLKKITHDIQATNNYKNSLANSQLPIKKLKRLKKER